MRKLSNRQFLMVNENSLRTGLEQVSEKKKTLKILFSDKKLVDIDGIYNSQNERVWAVDRSDADENDASKQKRKFPPKVMVWLERMFQEYHILDYLR